MVYIYTYPGSPVRPLNKWPKSEKTIILVGICNQQFQGTIILMVFDLQGIYIGILTQRMDPEDKSLNFIFPTKHVIPESLKFSYWLSEYIYIYYIFPKWWFFMVMNPMVQMVQNKQITRKKQIPNKSLFFWLPFLTQILVASLHIST